MQKQFSAVNSWVADRVRLFPAGRVWSFVFLGWGALSAGVVGEAAELRIASYNVWGLPAPLTVRPSRFKDLVREIPRLEQDVWGFQETFTAKAAGLARLPAFPYVAFGPGKTKAKISSGLLTISRFPIERTASWVFSKCAGTDCLSNKGVLYTRIRHPEGEALHVFNTHLTAAGSDEVRDSQVRELLKFVGREVSDSGPIILVGDYNFTPESQPYFRMLIDGSFEDTHAAYRWSHTHLSLEEWFGYTYDPDRNTNLRAQILSQPTRIDYIWTRRGSSSSQGQCEPFRIVRSGLVLDWKHQGRHLSDHFGQAAVLAWDRPCLSGDVSP